MSDDDERILLAPTEYARLHYSLNYAIKCVWDAHDTAESASNAAVRASGAAIRATNAIRAVVESIGPCDKCSQSGLPVTAANRPAYAAGAGCYANASGGFGTFGGAGPSFLAGVNSYSNQVQPILSAIQPASNKRSRQTVIHSNKPAILRPVRHVFPTNGGGESGSSTTGMASEHLPLSELRPPEFRNPGDSGGYEGLRSGGGNGGTGGNDSGYNSNRIGRAHGTATIFGEQQT